jgi:preprotein translocase subunit SecB
MAEQETNQGAEKPQQQFNIQRIYLKDVSFESPQAPDIFRSQATKPDVNVQMQNEVKQLVEGVYEVSLKITVTTEQEKKNIYLVEVEQSGVFSAVGFSEQELGHLLNAYCPTMLFPYAREAVSDLVSKGGFPQLLLAPVNFDAHYAQQLKNAATQAPADSAEAEVKH